MNLLSAQSRILQKPWDHLQRSWDATTLRDARRKVLEWEQLYSPMRQKIRHVNPLKKPTVPSFAKVDKHAIGLMITLGGEFFLFLF